MRYPFFKSTLLVHILSNVPNSYFLIIAFLLQGDYVEVKGGSEARVLFRGSYKKCRNKEKFLESFVEAHKEQTLESDFILDNLSCPDDEVSSVSGTKRKIMEEQRKVKALSHASVDLDVSASASIPLVDQSAILSPTKNSETPSKKVKSETNKLLRTIIKQNDSMINLLRCLVEQHGTSLVNSSSDNEYTAADGSKFTTQDISKSSPNHFAISFLKHLLGDDFKNTIIDPQGPTTLSPLPTEKVEILKTALSETFSIFVFQKVRRAVNQAARDLRNREKRVLRDA